MSDKPREKGASALEAGATDGILGPNPFVGLRPEDIVETIKAIANASLKQPTLVPELQARFTLRLFQILLDASDIQPDASDRRFSDPEWTDSRLHRAWLQIYLTWCGVMNEFVDRLTLDRLSKGRARFVISLLNEAMSPTNMLPGNPAALSKAIETRGSSIVEGIKNAVSDLLNNNALPSQVDKMAYHLGRDLAVSKGAVVFSNEMLELIHYAPVTEQVYARPQLIIPPQINKFYVFDLSPGKSIVEHLLKNGFQVFAVSWRNPVAEHCNWNLDAYVEALLQAVDATRAITGSDDVNLHGACSGAMTMTALLGYLASKKDTRVNAASLMVAVLGHDPDSLLSLFLTPEAVVAAKANSAMKGVLDGREMGSTFAWLRPKDLVWNYWVNNYLMGNRPPKFDILFWNNDTTRLPARFHAELLDVFAERVFERPGAVSVLGATIELGHIGCDTFVVAGLTDHITSWKGVYRSARLLGGQCEFILSSSGHIQSLINPPSNRKAKFFTNPKTDLPADEWLAGASERAGSWWTYWVEWLAARSGERRDAPAALGNDRFMPTIPAPGAYVFEK
jgi:polyhydroxyalkanoate synthase